MPLQQKRIAGTGIDVLEKGPIDPANPLPRLDNVVVSPHSAGATWNTGFPRADFAYQNMKRVWEGKSPEAVATDWDMQSLAIGGGRRKSEGCWRAARGAGPASGR